MKYYNGSEWKSEDLASPTEDGLMPKEDKATLDSASQYGKEFLTNTDAGEARDNLGLSTGATSPTGISSELDSGNQTNPRVWSPKTIVDYVEEGNIANLDEAKSYTDTAINSAKYVANVKDFGAVGNGTTDDTPAFQAAMDTLTSGGKLVVPGGGEYLLKSQVWIRDNVTVEAYGAVLRKKAGNSSYAAFQGASTRGKGYGAGASNISFLGGTYRGQFGSSGSGISITLHHSDSVTIKDITFEESVWNGHSVDLGGCSNVFIDNITVKGFAGFNSKPYSEAIQIDYSTAIGMPEDDPNSFDGLPTVNLTLQNSKFLPDTINGTDYPAPNMIGNHSRVEGMQIKNINILNNYIEGARETIDLTEGMSGYFCGWIHLFHAKNVLISGNVFKGKEGQLGTQVINMRPPSTGTALADVAVPGAASVSIPVFSPTNIRIINNVFQDFKSTDSQTMIYILGTSSVPSSGIKVESNVFSQCSSESSDYTSSGPTCININRSNGTSIKSNSFISCHFPIKLYYESYPVIEGNTSDRHTCMIANIDYSNNISVTSNVFCGNGGIWARGAQNYIISNNIFKSRVSAVGDTSGGTFLAINAAKNFIASNNTFQNMSGNTYTTRAFDVYGSSQAGRIINNIGTGTFSTAFAVIASNSSTTVTESGSVVGVD